MQIYSLAKRMLQNCSRLQCALRDKLTVYTHARLPEYCTMHMHHEETRDDVHNGVHDSLQRSKHKTLRLIKIKSFP